MGAPRLVHPTPLGVACYGIKFRAYGLAYFLGKHRAEGGRFPLAAAEYHAGVLRDYTARRLAQAETLRASRASNA